MTDFTFSKVDHVALAVRSIRDACRLFVEVLGAEFVGGGDNPDLDVKAVQLLIPPGTKIELLEPLSAASYLERYIEKHGEGIHHLTVYVDDVPSAVAALEEHGFGVVDTEIISASWHETFIRPSASFGALIQVAWARDRWDGGFPGVTLEDVLEGRIHVLKNVVSWKDTGEVVTPRPVASAR